VRTEEDDMRSSTKVILTGATALALALAGTGPAAGEASRRTAAQADEPAGGGGGGRKPVTLGLILQSEGAIVTPEVGTAAEAMVDYFNARHGGIGRRPMALEVCQTDDTAASATACAARFAADDDIHLVMESTTNPAAIADVLVPAGKALLAGGVDLGNTLRPGVSVMEPGTAGIADALFTFAATDLGVTHQTVFLADDPAIAGARPVIELIAANAGMTVDFVTLGFADDLTGPISQGIAAGSDGLAFVIAPNQCAPVGEALDALAIDLPVVVAELCITDEMVDSGLADGWYAGTQSVAPVVDGGWEATQIRNILDQYGDGADSGGLAGLGVGFTWIARDVLGQAGGARATDASVRRVLSTYASDGVLGFDRVSCPGPAPFVGACNASTLMVQVDGGEIHDAGGFRRTDFTIFQALLGPRP
jgi:ABC-type branched-subunit amino acid transport system substrate-binding protein